MRMTPSFSMQQRPGGAAARMDHSCRRIEGGVRTCNSGQALKFVVYAVLHAPHLLPHHGRIRSYLVFLLCLYPCAALRN